MYYADIEELQGKIITKIEGMYSDSESVKFYLDDGSGYELYHSQCCCESVWLSDVDGYVEDLLNSEVISATERTQDNGYGVGSYCSSTWTFYHFTTQKGSVVLRWVGESNGYYSESVNFRKFQ